MNVIFLDFDGVLITLHEAIHGYSLEDKELTDKIEKRMKILSDICKKYDAKIVVSSSIKEAIEEETMAIDPDSKWVQYIFKMFHKYGIECIGRTPMVEKRTMQGSYSMWKEDEIRLYLYRHPEINHYCVIDDDDLPKITHGMRSDLNKVRSHLVVVEDYNPNNIEATGLLEKHKEEVGKVLEKENEVKRLLRKKKQIEKKKNENRRRDI